MAPIAATAGAGARAELVASIPRLTSSYLSEGILYATEDHYLYRTEPSREGWIRFEELGKLPKINPNSEVRVKDFLARLRLVRDLRRNRGPSTLAVLKSGTILVFYNHIYRSTDGGKSFHSVLDIKKEGIALPFMHGAAVDRNDDVYFGEYDCSPRPHSIRLFKGTKDGTEWSVFHEFPYGEIFHVHIVRYDPYRDRLWVCTGDRDEESALFFIDEERIGLTRLGGGDQGWRIVALIPAEECLYWCSDDDREGSSIYRYDFTTNKREHVRFVGKPSYYATRLKDGTFVFSTAFENRTAYSERTREEPTTDLWVSRDGSDWTKVLSLMGKPGKLGWGTRRPQILLPAGDLGSDYLYATPVATEEGDFPLLVYRIRWD